MKVAFKRLVALTVCYIISHLLWKLTPVLYGNGSSSAFDLLMGLWFVNVILYVVACFWPFKK